MRTLLDRLVDFCDDLYDWALELGAKWNPNKKEIDQ